MCSTPFGITEVGIAARPRRRRLVSVLNAFRHHRGGHPGRPGLQSAVRFVLNAFRHHRGGHGTILFSQPTFQKCSTPFGITEVGMAGLITR